MAAQSAAEPSTGLWQARCAVLALLANYLHQSPAMQLKSVRDWDMVSALFELLWEEKARRIALRLVRYPQYPLCNGISDASGSQSLRTVC